MMDWQMVVVVVVLFYLLLPRVRMMWKFEVDVEQLFFLELIYSAKVVQRWQEELKELKELGELGELKELEELGELEELKEPGELKELEGPEETLGISQGMFPSRFSDAYASLKTKFHLEIDCHYFPALEMGPKEVLVVPLEKESMGCVMVRSSADGMEPQAEQVGQTY